jgi:hypothetical protein
MMKVGSQTIKETLQRSPTGLAVFYSQMFELGDNTLAEYRKMIADSSKERLPVCIDKMVRTLKARCAFGQRDKVPLWIVSLVRGPLQWAFSLHFQHAKYFLSYRQLKSELTPEIYRRLSQEFLVRSDFYLEVYNTWFEKEIEERFKIKIFSEPFDCKKGYGVYELGTTPLLLIRLEDLRRVYREAFRTSLGIELDSLHDRNRGQKKPYASLYSEFQERFVPPRSFVERICNTKTARHFYSASEIAEFKSCLE